MLEGREERRQEKKKGKEGRREEGEGGREGVRDKARTRKQNKPKKR